MPNMDIVQKAVGLVGLKMRPQAGVVPQCGAGSPSERAPLWFEAKTARRHHDGVPRAASSCTRDTIRWTSNFVHKTSGPAWMFGPHGGTFDHRGAGSPSKRVPSLFEMALFDGQARVDCSLSVFQSSTLAPRALYDVTAKPAVDAATRLPFPRENEMRIGALASHNEEHS